MTDRPGRIFVFFGTQGSNRKLLARTVQTRTGAKNLVKYSTRPPRRDDVEGMDNHFVTDGEFARMEHAEVFTDAVTSQEGFRFGVATDDVSALLKRGEVAFVTAPAPLDNLKAAYPDQVVRIFVYTDRESLRARLESSGASRFDVSAALKRYDQRTVYGKTCEHSVRHESFPEAFSELLSIVRSYWPADPMARQWPK